jgi:hypothetical protein
MATKTELKRTPVVQSAIDNGILTITVQGFEPVVVDPAAYPDALVRYAALHGFKQKYMDAAAIERDETTGKPALPADKYKAIMAVRAHHLETGEWNRTGGGDGGGDGLLVSALVEYLGQDAETVRATVGTWDKRTQAAMRADAQVAPIIARIRMAREAKNAKGVDTGALLAAMQRGQPAQSE